MKKLPDTGNPKFDHDCEVCTFLGTYEKHDLYHCKQATGSTVIARHSSDGPDYVSGMVFAKSLTQDTRADHMDASNRALRVAYLIAKDAGLSGT
jgi:hypothetical protein